MALVPTRQLHPAATFLDSFHSSSPNFHSLRFFRHRCDNLSSCTTTRNWFPCHSITAKRPSTNSTLVGLKKPIFPRNKSFCSESWLKRWNEPTCKHNRPKSPRAVLDYQGSGNGHSSKSGFSSSDDEDDGGGGGGNSTMDRIVEKLKKFGYDGDGIEKQDNNRTKERVIEKGSVEDIFYVEEGLLPNTRGGFSPESPFGVGGFGSDGGEVRFPWEKPLDEGVEERKPPPQRRKSKTSLAELTLPESELRRLLKLTFQKKHKTRVGGGGVTQAVVDKIHERWKTSEIVRLKFEGAAALNMKRIHEILEVCYLFTFSFLSCIFMIKSCFHCNTFVQLGGFMKFFKVDKPTQTVWDINYHVLHIWKSSCTVVLE